MVVVSIALPHAQSALRFSNADRQWIITAYSLAFGSLLLLSGRLADTFGQKPLFLTGVVGFAHAATRSGSAGWTDPQTIGFLIAGVVLLAAFAGASSAG